MKLAQIWSFGILANLSGEPQICAGLTYRALNGWRVSLVKTVDNAFLYRELTEMQINMKWPIPTQQFHILWAELNSTLRSLGVQFIDHNSQ